MPSAAEVLAEGSELDRRTEMPASTVRSGRGHGSSRDSRDGHRLSVRPLQPPIDQACIPLNGGVRPTLGTGGPPMVGADDAPYGEKA